MQKLARPMPKFKWRREIRNFDSCKICKKSNHATSNCWFHGKPQCRSYNRFGQAERYCRFKNNNKANFTEEQEDEGNMVYACQYATQIFFLPIFVLL